MCSPALLSLGLGQWAANQARSVIVSAHGTSARGRSCMWSSLCNLGTDKKGVHLWPFGRETFPKQNKNTRRERFPPDGNHRWDSFSHSWNAVGRVCTIFFILWLLLLWPSSRRPPYSNTITRGFVLQVNNNRYAQLGDSLTFVRWP